MKPRISFWLLGLLFFAFALRLFQLETQSIWWDEGISLHLATSENAEIVRDRLNNIHPPLYFYGLKGWLMVAGVNVFSARYLSVLASWLQVAAIFAIVRRWFAFRTAYVAGLLAAISAVSVIYSQEIRVYAVLPLVYLALLAITRELTRIRPTNKAGLWFLLGLVTWIGLHLHYITIFVVIYVTAWALIFFIKNRRWIDLWRWVSAQFLVLLASLPWFMAVLRNWTIVEGEANAGTFTTDPVPLRFLLTQVWTFHLTGLAGMLARPGAMVMAIIIASSLIILLFLRLIQKRTRRDTAVLLSNWLIPLSSALIVWTVRSFSHPRYVAIFVPGLIMLVAYLILPPVEKRTSRWARFTWVLSGLLLIGLITASLWGLGLYFFDPTVAKDDMRGVARYLEEMAEATDLILVPDTDWSLLFEFEGVATVAMPRLDDADGGWSHLSALTANTRRVFVVDYLNGTRDWQNRLPFSLEKAGSQVAQESYEGLSVGTYELEEPITAPQMISRDVNFNPLVLTGVWIEQDANAGDSLTVALSWQLSKTFNDHAHVTLRLLDDEDWSIASRDILLRDAYGRPTNQWPVGETITTYHVIPVSPAIPPLAYELGVQVYLDSGAGIQPLDVLDNQGAPKGQEAVIGLAQMAYAPVTEISVRDSLPIDPKLEPLDMAPGLSLLAAEVERGTHSSGDQLAVQLLWQAIESPLANMEPELALVQGNNDLDVSAGAPVYGRYPTNLWNLGERVYERRQLSIPPTASGKIQVVLRLGDMEILIDELEVQAGNHDFDRVPVTHKLDKAFGDVARLTGFDLSKEKYSTGETLPLILVWQSTTNGSKVDYVVFAHLLAEDGHLIGQHDGPPGNGTKNVTGWLMDEYVLDRHEVVMKEEYQGQATIEVGLYDPVSGERLLLSDGSDHLILPITVNMVP